MAKDREEGSTYADAGVTEMILGVQSGDAESFEGLKSKYAPLVMSAVGGFAVGETSRSELEREAETALLKAAVRYDTKQNKVAFGLFAKICIKNALISYKRKEQARMRKEAKALEAVSQRENTNKRFSYIGESRDTDQLIESISGVLSPYEKKIFMEYMSGKSIGEIAETVGRNVKSVNNAIYRIREKVRRSPESGSAE